MLPIPVFGDRLCSTEKAFFLFFLFGFFFLGLWGVFSVAVVAGVCCRGTRVGLVLQLRLIEALPFLSLSLSIPLAFFLLFSSSVFYLYFFLEFFLHFSVFVFLFLSVCFFSPLSFSLSLSLSAFLALKKIRSVFVALVDLLQKKKQKKLERCFFPADEVFLMR